MRGRRETIAMRAARGFEYHRPSMRPTAKLACAVSVVLGAYVSLAQGADPAAKTDSATAGAASSSVAGSTSATTSSTTAGEPAPFDLSTASTLSGVASTTASAPRPPAAPPEDTVARTIPVQGEPLGQDLPSRFEGKPLVWDPRFTRVDALQVGTLFAATGIALATNILTPRDTGWSRPTKLDDSARNAFRLSSYDARSRARDASDVSLAVLTMYPFVVDTLMVAYWYRGSADVAQQMFVIDAEAMAITAAIQGTTTYLFGRQRPYTRDCGSSQLPNDTIECSSTSKSRSFFSGHSAQAFVSASLICSHHFALDLYDSAADAITCATALTAAAGTAMLRVMGDMHYLTDVLTGAAIGTLVGFGIPWFHHYRRVSGTKSNDATRLQVVPTIGGLSLLGEFR